MLSVKKKKKEKKFEHAVDFITILEEDFPRQSY